MKIQLDFLKVLSDVFNLVKLKSKNIKLNLKHFFKIVAGRSEKQT